MSVVCSAVIEPDFVTNPNSVRGGLLVTDIPGIWSSMRYDGGPERSIPINEISGDGELDFARPFLVSIASVIVDCEDPREGDGATFVWIQTDAIEFGTNEIGIIRSIEYGPDVFESSERTGVIPMVWNEDGYGVRPVLEIGTEGDTEAPTNLASYGGIEFGKSDVGISNSVEIARDDVA